MDLTDSFIWTEYLEKTGGKPAEWKCFKQHRTAPQNHFEVNCLLETVDQRSAIQETPPPRLTGDEEDSEGRCLASAASLPSQPLPATGSGGGGGKQTALSGVFTRRSHLASGQVRRFRVATFSLARVVETCGPRLRVRLVGTDDRNDCWCLVDSDQIRPYPSGESLQPPFGYVHSHLVWNKTLRRATESNKFAQHSWFIPPPVDPEGNFFKVGEKLEAVDRRNTQLICPATIAAVSGLHVLVSFDGWSGTFDYWTRFDSRDLFPVGWCRLAGHTLQSPGPQAMRLLNLSVSPPKRRPAKRLLLAASRTRRRLAFTRRRSGNKKTGLNTEKQVPPLVRSPLGLTSIQQLLPLAVTPILKAVIKPKALSVRTAGVGQALGSTLTCCSENSSMVSLSSPPVIHPIGEDPQFARAEERPNDGPPTIDDVCRPTPRETKAIEAGVSFGAGMGLHSESYAVYRSSGWQDGAADLSSRRRKKKKHRRHGSKQHRHSSKLRHSSSSLSDGFCPTKLVIRTHSSEMPVRRGALTDSTHHLYVETRSTNWGPRLEAESLSGVHPRLTHSQAHFRPIAGESEMVYGVSPTNTAPSGDLDLGTVASASCRMASSTVSPSSMDLGPCPLLSPALWTIDDVHNYLILKDPSLTEVAGTFKHHEIDGQALLLLNMESLRSYMKVKLGPSLKLDYIIARLKKGIL